MNLISTSLMSGLATAVRIGSGFVLNKIFAVYIGPAGLALTGQFGNFVSMVLGFSNGGISSGIVKYVAEYRNDPEKRTAILSTALIITLCSSFILSILILIFHRQLAILLLKSESYASIFLLFALTLTVFSLNSSLISVLNGFKEVRKFIAVNIATSLTSLLITLLLVVLLGLYGALLTVVLSQTLVFFVTMFFVMRSDWFRWDSFTKGLDKASFTRLSGFSAMALVSALTVPLSQMLVRNYLVDHLSLEAAGLWQGVWRISEMYLMIVTTPLSIYYLPRLSEIKDRLELRREIFSGYRLILPVVAILALAIFFSRHIIIRILFTREFSLMSELFLFQLIGDFFKVASWLIAYLMVAQAMTRMFMVTEIIFATSFVLLSMGFVSRYGLVGVTYAFAINYLVYLLLMLYTFRNLLRAGRVA